MTTVPIHTFNDDQLAFAELAAKAFATVEDHVETPPGLAELRASLAELALPVLAVPEQLGGGGMTELDVVLIIEEAGYADVPPAVAETLGAVAPMLARYGSEALRERWLSSFAQGESLGTTWCPESGPGGRPGADVALVELGGQVHAVEVAGLPAGPVAEAQLAAASTGVLNEPAAAVPELRARGVWVTATLLNGVARRLLELSLEHARTREQFGSPIGSFQAVRHMLADVAVALESARPTAWQTARALAAEEADAGVLARAAKSLANRAGGLANDHGLQVHGGIGFTLEHPVHRWLLHGHELESRWGSAASHEAALGRFALECDSLLATFAP